MKYSILIVEDEPLVAQRIFRLTTEILHDRLDRITTASTLAQAEGELQKADHDLILLDLNLAGQDGFSLLPRITAKAPHVIVISAQTERALEAFEYGVLDFVPKPFTRPRLEKALSRLWLRESSANPATKHLSFEGRRGVEVIKLQDVLFFKAADKYSEAVLRDGTTRFHDKPLNRLEHILETDFIRTHKSYLVHQQAIQNVKSLEGSRYAVKLMNGDQLPVGRTRIDHVRQLIERLSA